MPRPDGCSGLSTEPLQRQSFLLSDRQATLAAVQGRRGGAPPFLVEYLHKSAELPPMRLPGGYMSGASGGTARDVLRSGNGSTPVV
jgi:hypothetical protein